MSSDSKNEKSKNNFDDDSIDWAQLEYNLSLTPEQRIEQHQRALDLYFALKKAGEELNAKTDSAS
jgi:hypothetical protein